MSDEIRVLERGEAIRRRPGIFLRHWEQDGCVHDLLWEVLGNVIDLHRGGLASEVRVDVRDGWAIVRDDGPGIPVVRREHSILELLFMGCHGGLWIATRGMNLEHIPTMHGEVVNALSMRTEVETTREGFRWAMAFERGNVVEPLRQREAGTIGGTTVRFRPDPAMFKSSEFDLKRIELRLRQLAWVCPRLHVFFQGRQLPGRRGLRDWANELAGGRPEALFAIDQRIDEVNVDLAIAWSGDGEPRIHSFANARPTLEGGTHVDGLWAGLTTFAAPSSTGGTASNLAVGLIAIVCVDLEFTKFTSATHDALANPEAAKAVECVVGRVLADAGEYVSRRLGSKPTR
jgi:DNA gyrase/topoisomerase IV subunit B